MENTKKVAIIMGSDSDWPTVKAAAVQLKSWDIPFEVRVMSAHRTPAAAAEFAKRAAENGFGVIIAAAGMAAHLAGSIAANTVLPVVGIPVKGGAVDGLDALLATVQMPSGIPVATVALNGAKTPPCWPLRCWPSTTRASPRCWRRTGRKWPAPSLKRTPPSGPRRPRCKECFPNIFLFL